jgi:hypothetical protein
VQVGKNDKGGVAIVISDTSLLSNQLLFPLTQPDTDNKYFAKHLVSFLATAPDENAKRTGCLFYSGDQHHSNFDSLTVPEPDVLPSWGMIQHALANAADKAIDELQRKDFPHEPLMRRMTRHEMESSGRNMNGLKSAFEADHRESRQAASRRLTTWLVTMAAIAAGLLILRAAYLNRLPRSSNEPIVTAQSEPPNIGMAAREKYRWLFAEWQVPSSRTPPRVAVDGSWFYRNRMQRDVNRLWRIAWGQNPSSINPRRWNALDRLARGIGEARDAGRLRFPEAGS